MSRVTFFCCEGKSTFAFEWLYKDSYSMQSSITLNRAFPVKKMCRAKSMMKFEVSRLLSVLDDLWTKLQPCMLHFNMFMSC